MAKFLDNPLAGVALGAGPVVGAQILGATMYAKYDAGSGMPEAGMMPPSYLKWSQSIAILLGLGVAGVLYAMKEQETAKIAAVSAVGGGALGAYYEIKSNMAPAVATPSADAPPADVPVSTSTQGAVIQARGFGRSPMVSLFGRGRTQILGPSAQVAARATSQNVAAFGGGHF